jgi:hypothetical protein
MRLKDQARVKPTLDDIRLYLLASFVKGIIKVKTSTSAWLMMVVVDKFPRVNENVWISLRFEPTPEKRSLG